MATVQVTKTIKEKCHDFWLKPENYGQVPSRTAFELLKEGRMTFTSLMENIRNDANVDDSFEGLCKEVAQHQCPELVPMKREGANFYQFLEEHLMGLDSEESIKEDEENEFKKKELEMLQETMFMLSGRNTEIQRYLEMKRILVAKDRKMGLKMLDHPKWVMWTEFTDGEKEVYKATFWTVSTENEDLATAQAEEAAKKMREQRIQKEVEAKEKKTKKRKLVEMKEEKKATKRPKKAKEMVEDKENKEEVARTLDEIFGEFNQKELF